MPLNTAANDRRRDLIFTLSPFFGERQKSTNREVRSRRREPRYCFKA